MKKCPYCAEEIQDEAILCKHCGKEYVADLKAHQDHAKSKYNQRIRIILIVVVGGLFCELVFYLSQQAHVALDRQAVETDVQYEKIIKTLHDGQAIERRFTEVSHNSEGLRLEALKLEQETIDTAIKNAKDTIYSVDLSVKSAMDEPISKDIRNLALSGYVTSYESRANDLKKFLGSDYRTDEVRSLKEQLDRRAESIRKFIGN